MLYNAQDVKQPCNEHDKRTDICNHSNEVEHSFHVTVTSLAHIRVTNPSRGKPLGALRNSNLLYYSYHTLCNCVKIKNEKRKGNYERQKRRFQKDH